MSSREEAFMPSSDDGRPDTASCPRAPSSAHDAQGRVALLEAIPIVRRPFFHMYARAVPITERWILGLPAMMRRAPTVFDPNRRQRLHARKTRKEMITVSIHEAMTKNSPRFGYPPLGARHIRMLQLHPAATMSDPIICSLHTWPLDSLPAPFEALSYTWGDVQQRYWIAIDGLAFPVGTNLLCALQQFRRADQARFLWVDAICINQEDLTERGAGVQVMDLIYQRAAQVLIWLGVASNNSHAAFALLKRVEGIMKEEVGRLGIGETARRYTRQDYLPARGLPPPEDPGWLALDGVFWRAWFLRVWVVQEVCVARGATVFCGADHMDFDVFCDVAHYMYSTALTEQVAVRADRVLSLQTARGQYQRHERTSLATQLIRSRGCMATDPADKVFALLNLAQEVPGDGNLRADYHQSTAGIFSAVARLLLSESLDILNCNSDRVWQAERNLPSWAPDWSSVPREYSLLLTPHGSSFHAGQRAGGAAQAPAPAVRFSPDGRVLFLKGRILDRVRRISESHFTSPWVLNGKVYESRYNRFVDQDDYLLSFSRSRRLMMWEYMALRLKTYPATGEDIFTVFQRTLTADAPWTDPVGGSLRPEPASLHDLYSAFQGVELLAELEGMGAMTEDERRVQLERHGLYAQAVHTAAYARKLFTTRTGFLGLGPVSTSTGMHVAVFKGARTAYVLDKKRNGHYVLVGEAYLHGFMHGEGVRDESLLEELAIV